MECGCGRDEYLAQATTCEIGDGEKAFQGEYAGTECARCKRIPSNSFPHLAVAVSLSAKYAGESLPCSPDGACYLCPSGRRIRQRRLQCYEPQASINRLRLALIGTGDRRRCLNNE